MILFLFFISAAFALNGELLCDSQESSIAFENIDTSEGFMPAITLFAGEKAQMHFGQFGDSGEELKYFVNFEDSGYSPMCSQKSLQYNIPLWYSSHGGFEMLDDKTSNSSKFITKQKNSTISVRSRDWDHSMPHDQQCIRLNMGFTVSSPDSTHHPTLVPRPGLLTPSPSAESFDLTFEDSVREGASGFSSLSFSVIFPPGQVPSSAYVGWTTPSFCYMESSVADEQVSYEKQTHNLGTSYSQHVEMCASDDNALSSGISFHTAFMVCLRELLPVYTPQLAVPVK